MERWWVKLNQNLKSGDVFIIPKLTKNISKYVALQHESKIKNAPTKKKYIRPSKLVEAENKISGSRNVTF